MLENMRGKSAPILASLDIAKTLKFYQETLHFSIMYGNDPNYGIVHRDEIVIHFWKTDDPEIPKQTGFYLYLRSGIDELYEEYTQAGVIHPNAPMSLTPYGMKEFAILDCDGNLIRIGQSLEPETDIFP